MNESRVTSAPWYGQLVWDYVNAYHGLFDHSTVAESRC